MATALFINNSAAINDPCPNMQVSLSTSPNKTLFGKNKYTITIYGVIYWSSGKASHNSDNLTHIANKKKEIINTFENQNDITVELRDSNANAGQMAYRHCVLQSINFGEIEYNKCTYEIVLTSHTRTTTASSSSGTSGPTNGRSLSYFPITLTTDQTNYAKLLEDVNITFDISPDYGFGAVSSNTNSIKQGTTAISLTVSATGIGSKTQSGAITQAKNFLSSLTDANFRDIAHNLCDKSVTNHSESLYNHSRSTSIDYASGTVSITDTFIGATSDSDALENFEVSISDDASDPFVTVTVNGTIKGLDNWTPRDSAYSFGTTANSRIKSASDHWDRISANGNLTSGSQIYKRANTAVNLNLNWRPVSTSVGINEVSGEITYSVSFNNRPVSVFKNTLQETINITDTYPGDQFAVIPVIGRSDGPVLQFTFGRTEYKRSLDIDILLDFDDVRYERPGRIFVTSKPSCNNNMKQDLLDLIDAVSPANEPSIQKWFLSPPRETWSPTSGRYTLSMEWTYELS
jgi:hypothetical protein